MNEDSLCPRCGTPMTLEYIDDCEEDGIAYEYRSDFVGEDLPEEEDTLVQAISCPNCGAQITAFYPKE